MDLFVIWGSMLLVFFCDLGVDVDGFFGDLGVDVHGFFCDLVWNLNFKPRKKLLKGWDHVRTMRGAICYRMNGTRASGTACGSSYGHLKF